MDFNKLGGIGLQDADNDQLDDRVTENIQVGSEELVDTLAFPELGIIWGGGRRQGVHSVAVGGPQLKIIATDGGPIREVSRLAPLGVPTAREGGQLGNPNYPAAFQAQVTVGSGAPQLQIEVTSLGPTGFPIGSAGTEEFLPAVKLEGEKAVELDRQAANPWEEGSTLYLSKPVVTIADLRAMIAYQKTSDENAACVRCDQVAEHLYDTQPLPANYLPELLSGHRVAVSWSENVMAGLRAVYGNLVGAPTTVPSVPWETSAAIQQEPALNPSKGYGDVAEGTLLHSGEFSHEATDLSFPGVGFDFVFSRTYRNQTVGNGPLGPGWDHNWNLRLRVLPNGEVELYDGRGRRDLVSTPDASKLAQLKPKVGFHKHQTGYVVTDSEGNKFQFDTAGRLLSIADPLKAKGNGRGSEIEFSYDSASLLVGVKIHDETAALAYTEGRLSRLRDPSGREWRYHYDGEQRLVRVENPQADLGEGTGEAIDTLYGYVASPESGGMAAKTEALDDLDTIVDARGVQILNLDYETVPGSHATRLKKQVLGAGPGSVDFSYVEARTDVTDRRGFLRQYEHDACGHLKRYTDPASNAAVWNFVDFESGKRNGLVQSMHTPDGRLTYFEHEESPRQLSLRTISKLKKIVTHAHSTPTPSDKHEACARGRNSLPVDTLVLSGHHELTNAPASVRGPNGQLVEIRYSESGLVEEATIVPSSVPLTMTLENDSYGRPAQASVAEAGGGETRNVVSSKTYDNETGRVMSESIRVSGSLQETTFLRDERGNATRVNQPGDVSTSYLWNQLDWLLEKCSDTTGKNACTRYHYNEIGQPVRIEEPFGSGQHLQTRIVYGSLGEVKEIHREVAPGGPELSETRTYDANLNLLEVDPAGLAKTSYTYDDVGRVASVSEVLGNSETTTVTYSYNEASQVTSYTDGEQTWKIEYDGFGRPARSEDPQERITYWHYDAGGNVVHEAVCHGPVSDHKLLSEVTRQFTAGGQLLEEVVLAKTAEGAREDLRTAVEYDNRSRPISIMGPDNSVKLFRYDELGRVVREAIPGFDGGTVDTRYLDQEKKIEKIRTVGNRTVVTETVFNGLGLPISVNDGLSTLKYHYDDAGNLIRTELPGNINYFYTYDGLGRPLTITQPEGIAENFNYVDLADTSTIHYQDALGQTTILRYGTAGELLSTTYPDQTTDTLSYDKNGNVLLVDRPGMEITQQFDQFDRLISRVRSEGEGPADSESFAWDELDRPTQATVGSQTTAWVWDTASRLRGETQADRTLTFAPFPTGAPGRTRYPSGLEVVRNYNDAGSLSAVHVESTPLASYVQRGGGLLSAQQGPLSGQFEFDGAGRPQRTRWNASSRILDESLGFDARGLPLTRSRADLGQQWTYGYDQAARLKTAELDGAASSVSGEFSYAYDAAQNLVRKKKTSACGEVVIDLPNDDSHRNRPGNVAGDELQWDSRGRLVGKRDLRFDYDDRDRLVAVRRQLSPETSEPVAAYTYDIQGRRVQREVGELSLRTVWDGWQAIEDYAGTEIQGQRFYGAGLDQILQLNLPIGNALTPHFPVYDSLGNLTSLVRVNGEAVERYDYDPYGFRFVTANDHQSPALEQVRLEGGELKFQLSEPTVKDFQLSSIQLQNLSRPEQPELEIQAVNAAGRQSGRQLVFKNGGVPNDDPPTWPEPGEHVKLVVAAGSFEDQFGNTSAVYTYADLVWPGANGILVDNIKPRIEEICAQGNQLKVTFSEKVSPSLAESVFEVDSDAVSWESENEGYTLKTELATGPHSLSFATSPLDLAGLGFAAAGSQSFTTSGVVKAIYSAPFPGEAGDSLVGNPYGFQGLPQDGETGFLYVRNRYYDPELGRFITPDPQGYGDGPNLYQFGLNNPIVNRDPTGEAVQVIPCSIAGAIGVGVGWGIDTLLGEDYDSTDAAIDFGIGALTCGVGNAIGLATKLSPLARFGLNAGADASLTVAAEATRSFIHGEEITAGGLLRSGALSVGVGHILPYTLKLGRNVKPVEAMLDSAGPKIGTFSADGRMVDLLDWDSVVPVKGKYKGQNRIDHVNLHNIDNPNKLEHGIFLEDAVTVTNEAWGKAKGLGLSPQKDGILHVPMGRQIGWAGGIEGSEAAVPLSSVTIKVVPGTNKLITAYPNI